MLDYTSKEIEKHIRQIREYRDRTPEADKAGLERVLREYEGTADPIRKYDALSNVFDSRGQAALYLDSDIQKFKGYSYLVAKAGDICFKLYEKGYRTNSPTCGNLGFEMRTIALYYAKGAILVGDKELAVRIVSEDSLLGAAILGDDERAKTYLPKDIKDIHWAEVNQQILWPIVYHDEKKMNACIEKIKKADRRYAKKCGYVSSCMDGWTMALLKLARERDLHCNLNIIELPLHILDDDTPVNKEEWKLPEDKELEKILST